MQSIRELELHCKELAGFLLTKTEFLKTSNYEYIMKKRFEAEPRPERRISGMKKCCCWLNINVIFFILLTFLIEA